jgi:hypothetical protein
MELDASVLEACTEPETQWLYYAYYAAVVLSHVLNMHWWRQ